MGINSGAVSRVETVVRNHADLPGHTLWVKIEINENQRLIVHLAPGDGLRLPLRVEWQRRPSERHSWDGPHVERNSVGHGRLDINAFEVIP